MAETDTLVGIGCDYITVTAPESGGLNSLHSYASSLYRHQADVGNKVKPWGLSGFKGWKCGSVEIGTRDDLVMVRLHSDAAQISWRRLAELATNITRFDVQATVLIDGDVTRTIDMHKRAARLDAKKGHDRKVVRWIEDNRGGYTLYLGHRESLCFGRIYDKFVQSKLVYFKNCVRFEVQFQRELAHSVARAMLQTHSELPRVASHLTQFFEARGVRPGLQYNDGATYCCTRPRSDTDKNLEWLRAAVRPCVMRLIALGEGEATLRALGLIDDGESHPVQLDQQSETVM
jgi:DNA relaxase NicK